MRTLFLAILTATALVGCAPKGSIDFSQSTTPPAAVETSSSRITIPMGIAVAIHARPRIDGSAAPDGTTVKLTARDESIIGIRTTTGKDFPFVLVGIAKGTTIVDVEVSGSTTSQITATVTDPAGG
jgi:hypothetical protein